ncbi:MAG: hypothetical protein ACE5FD_17675, partial [Anaerolineae bacterium]
MPPPRTHPPPNQPTSQPTATSTPIPGSPIIHFFRASTDPADPGDTIQLKWQISDADSINIYHLERGGPMGEPHWEVAASAAVTYTIRVGERESTSFILFAANAAGGSQATVTIALTCPDEWFFTPAPEGCPAGPPLFSDAAAQPFEHGLMIWVKEMDAIIVLFDDGRSPHWRMFSDNWNEGDPVDDPAIQPPSGLYQPVRGFGLVWRQETGVRDRLGWGAEIELAYGTAVQRNSPPKYPTIYVLAQNGGVWALL